jgi:two-component system alkaline phosphatase synthesis response regulator PhoP
MPKKILIVDDEPHIRLLLSQTLEEIEDQGVELLTAVNGEEALKTIQSEQPQLVKACRVLRARRLGKARDR